MRQRHFEDLVNSASIVVAAAVDYDLEYPESLIEQVDVVAKVVFGDDTKSIVFKLQGSNDGSTWVDLMCQNMTAATVALVQSLTLTGDTTKVLLRCETIMPKMRVYIDNTGSTNAATVSVFITGY